MEYLNKKDLAKMLCVTVRTISNYSRQGKLPTACRIGDRPLWRKSEIEECLMRSRVNHVVVIERAKGPGRPRKFPG
jgi:predicted site-specific integrase-resolvase